MLTPRKRQLREIERPPGPGSFDTGAGQVLDGVQDVAQSLEIAQARRKALETESYKLASQTGAREVVIEATRQAAADRPTGDGISAAVEEAYAKYRSQAVAGHSARTEQERTLFGLQLDQMVQDRLLRAKGLETQQRVNYRVGEVKRSVDTLASQLIDTPSDLATVMESVESMVAALAESGLPVDTKVLMDEFSDTLGTGALHGIRDFALSLDATAPDLTTQSPRQAAIADLMGRVQDGEFDALISPQRKAQFTRQLRADAERQLATRNSMFRAQKTAFNRHLGATKSFQLTGRPLSDESIEQMRDLAPDALALAGVEQIEQANHAMRLYLQADLEDRGSMLEAARDLGAEGSIESFHMLKAIEGVHRTLSEDLKRDPFGTAERNDPVLQELMEDPNVSDARLAERASEWAGQDVPPMRRANLDQLAQQVGNATSSDEAIALVGAAMEGWSSKQVARAASLMGSDELLIPMIVARANGDEEGQADARDLWLGMKKMTGEGQFRFPEKEITEAVALRGDIKQALNDTTMQGETRRRRLVQAARAYYAVAIGGMGGGDLEGTVWNQSLDRAFGSPASRFNGRWVQLAGDTSAGQLAHTIRRMKPEDLMKFASYVTPSGDRRPADQPPMEGNRGIPLTADVLADDAQLIQVGPNAYNVILGTGVLTSPDGLSLYELHIDDIIDNFEKAPSDAVLRARNPDTGNLDLSSIPGAL